MNNPINLETYKTMRKIIPLTIKHIKNKKLVINLLKREDALFQGDIGQKIFSNPLYGGLYSNEPQKIIQRKVLSDFGFSNDDNSLKLYRSIISHYYKNSTNYDKDVMNAITYFRENRCLYYKNQFNIGDKLIDVPLIKFDKKELKASDSTLYAAINYGNKNIDFGGAILCSFSQS